MLVVISSVGLSAPIVKKRTGGGDLFCAGCGEQLSFNCPKCQYNLPIGSRFCIKCGCKTNNDDQVDELETADEIKYILCPFCEDDCLESDDFCAKCGMALWVTCSECKNDVLAGSQFCKYCGHLASEVEAKTNTIKNDTIMTIQCLRCGQEIKSSDTSCSNCGMQRIFEKP